MPFFGNRQEWRRLKLSAVAAPALLKRMRFFQLFMAMVVASQSFAQTAVDETTESVIIREIELAQELSLGVEQLDAVLQRSAEYVKNPIVSRMRRPLSVRRQVLGCYGGKVGKNEFGLGLMGMAGTSQGDDVAEAYAPGPGFEARLTKSIVHELRANTVRSATVLAYRLYDRMPEPVIAGFVTARLCGTNCSEAEKGEISSLASAHIDTLKKDGMNRSSPAAVAEEMNAAFARGAKSESRVREYHALLSRPEAMVFYADSLRERFFESLTDKRAESPRVTPYHLARAYTQVLAAGAKMISELKAADGSHPTLKSLLTKFPIALPRIVNRSPEIVGDLCPLFKEIDDDYRTQVATGQKIDAIFRWLSAGLLVVGGVVLTATLVGAWAGPGMILASRMLILGLPLSLGQVGWSGYNYVRKDNELSLFVNSQLTGNLDPRDGKKYLEMVQLRDSVIFDFAVNVGFLFLGTPYGKQGAVKIVRALADRAMTEGGMRRLEAVVSRMRTLGMRPPKSEAEAMRNLARLSLPADAAEDLIQARVLQMRAYEASARRAKMLTPGTNGEVGDASVKSVVELVDKVVSLK